MSLEEEGNKYRVWFDVRQLSTFSRDPTTDEGERKLCPGPDEAKIERELESRKACPSL